MGWTPDSYQPIARIDGPDLLPGAAWYEATRRGDYFAEAVEPGHFDPDGWLTFDAFNDGDTAMQVMVTLRDAPPTGAGDLGGGAMPNAGADVASGFTYTVGLYPRCQARARLPMSALSLGRWMYDREGALLKPMTGGRPIRARGVRWVAVSVQCKGAGPQRFCLTPVAGVKDEPPKLLDPVCPAGVLLDEIGQSAVRNWPGKSRDAAEVVERMTAQRDAHADAEWPDGRDRWGGFDGGVTCDATGFFRTHHDGRRWWLVDPDGRPFWSAGPDCVRVDAQSEFRGMEQQLAWLPERDGEYAAAYDRGGRISYLATNLIRAFGDDFKPRWADLSLGLLRAWGFNTVGNWSDDATARAASFPYVKPMAGLPGDRSGGGPPVPFVFRDFPDVYHPDFPAACAAWATQLNATRDDPALIGHFLMNEPTWAFAAQTPAEGMLRNTDRAHARDALATWLRDRHGVGGDDLAVGWRMPGVTLSTIATGRFDGTLSPEAQNDLKLFSGEMVARLFGPMADACRAADPNHLILGVRYASLPPEWMLAGMGGFDVFSYNSYTLDPQPRAAEIAATLNVPTLVGEFHFGATDVGLPAAALVTVASQADRAAGYRRFVESHAATPHCVGAHWFTLYDQSAIGRFDGECYNCGLLDVCHRPYDALVAAAIETHGRLLDVASGRTEPFAGEVRVVDRVSV